MTKTLSLIAVLAVLAVFVLSGCGKYTASGPQVSQPADSGGTGEKPASNSSLGSVRHIHAAAHGGMINSISDFHVELVLDVAASKLTAYILGEDGTTNRPIDAQLITAEAKPEGSEKFASFTLSPAPQAKERLGAVSRFEAPIEDLVKTKAFELLLRIPISGNTFRTVFQVETGKVSLGKTFMCPMKHDINKVYTMPGKCEACGMALAECMNGALEHTDHTPKHGGVFFMASDNWHHLEGVLVSPHEFRLYLYDNFTKPIAATLYEATVEFVREDAQGKEFGNSKTIVMKPSDDSVYLCAKVPSEYVIPLYLTVRIKLREGERPSLFNFSFNSISKPEIR